MDQKIVRLPSTVFTGGSQVCEACGSPRQTGSFCRGCAFQLIDVALSSHWEADVGIATNGLDGEGSTIEAPRLRYDHLEICLSADDAPWELGRGSMGITYKAIDTRLGCAVALKIINARCLDSSGAQERFLREARTAARLRHPNIASVFHLGSGDENCYYTMEYIEGETLEARIRRAGAFPWQTALRVTEQVACALRAAHAQSFIHRDIKPSNIMIVGGVDPSDEEFSVKLIDFGLVKAAVEDHSARDPVDHVYFAGTPVYASPEQRDFGCVDARADIFSLGQCLRYMLTGRPPSLSPLEADNDGPPTPMIPLLRRMTEPDPDLRPQTTAELLLELRACTNSVHGDHGDHGEKGADVRSKALFRRKASVVALASIVLLALFVPCGWLAYRAKARAARLDATVLCTEGDEFRHKFTEADNQRSIDLYSRAIAKAPGLADAHAGLALAYCQQVARFGAPSTVLDLAVQSAQRAIATEPERSKGYGALGVIRSQQGRPWDALSQLHRALELDPQDTQALRFFSTLWQFVGQPHKGLPWAKRVVELEPANKRGWNAAADASVDLCADEDAKQYYRRCLEIDPRMMAAHCGLLHIHLLEEDFASAREDYTLAKSIEPGSLHALTLKAQIDLFSGDFAAAEATYRRLLQMDPKGQITYFGGISYLSALGLLRLQAGDPSEANLFLKQAMQMHLEPTDNEGPQAIYDLAAIRAVQGHPSDALVLLERAIRSGWIDYRVTRLDPRFQSLRKEPKFVRMLSGLNLRVKEMREEAGLRCAKAVVIADYPIQAPGW